MKLEMENLCYNMAKLYVLEFPRKQYYSSTTSKSTKLSSNIIYINVASKFLNVISTYVASSGNDFNTANVIIYSVYYQEQRLITLCFRIYKVSHILFEPYFNRFLRLPQIFLVAIPTTYYVYSGPFVK